MWKIVLKVLYHLWLMLKNLATFLKTSWRNSAKSTSSSSKHAKEIQINPFQFKKPRKFSSNTLHHTTVSNTANAADIQEQERTRSNWKLVFVILYLLFFFRGLTSAPTLHFSRQTRHLLLLCKLLLWWCQLRMLGAHAKYTLSTAPVALKYSTISCMVFFVCPQSIPSSVLRENTSCSILFCYTTCTFSTAGYYSAYGNPTMHAVNSLLKTV